jgi:hypothetical protein
VNTILKKLMVSIFAIAALLFWPVASSAHMDHSKTHEVSAAEAPQIKLSVERDSLGGFNVNIATEKFIWSPERASGEHVMGEGHAHIYVNNEKIGRVYGDWYHLSLKEKDIPLGMTTVSVDLNGNDHAVYAIDGVPVMDSVEIEVLASDLASNEQMATEQPTNGLSSGAQLVFTVIITLIALFLGVMIGMQLATRKP